MIVEKAGDGAAVILDRCSRASATLIGAGWFKSSWLEIFHRSLREFLNFTGYFATL